LVEHANLIPAVVICEMLDSETGGALSVNKASQYSKKFDIPLVESSQIKTI
jgi:3,4-dihydroxy 2-butanone 4-phosphate synthase